MSGQMMFCSGISGTFNPYPKADYPYFVNKMGDICFKNEETVVYKTTLNNVLNAREFARLLNDAYEEGQKEPRIKNNYFDNFPSTPPITVTGMYPSYINKINNNDSIVVPDDMDMMCSKKPSKLKIWWDKIINKIKKDFTDLSSNKTKEEIKEKVREIQE